MYLAPAEVRLKPGETVNFSVKIDTGREAVSGIEMAIVFDPVLLRPVGKVKPGTAFPDLTSQPGRGQITLSGQGAILGQGKVATLSFEALRSGNVEVKISQSSLVWDEAGQRNTLRQATGAIAIIE